MQSVDFTIPADSARVNYHYPVDFARAVLARVKGKGDGSLWLDFQEERDPYCAHILSGHQKVAAFVFTRRFPDWTTEGKLVSAVPEFFEMLRQALVEFMVETVSNPA